MAATTPGAPLKLTQGTSEAPRPKGLEDSKAFMNDAISSRLTGLPPKRGGEARHLWATGA